MTLQISRWLAIIGGVVVPILETLRRWSTWRESPANLFDDYIMGAFLLYAAWLTGRDARRGQPFLSAAWAFACGLGYYSFFGQLKSVRLGEADPSAISSEAVLIVKGVAVAFAILGLILSLRRPSERTDR